MKGLECPCCKKDVINLWRLLIFPFPFWLTKACQNCGSIVKFDYNVVMMFLFSIFLGALLGRIIIIFIPIVDSVLFSVPFIIFFAYLPFLFGKKLFINKSPCLNRKTKNEQDDQKPRV